MVKVNSKSIVRITVGTLLADLMDHHIPIMQKLVDKSVTWDSFLRNNGVTLDPQLYCLSAVNGRIRALIQDKISDVTDNYKRVRSEYKVFIVRRQARQSYRNRSPQRPQNYRPQVQQQNVTESTLLDDAHLRHSSRPRKPTKRYAEEEEELEQELEDEEMEQNNDDEVDSGEEPIVAPASPAGPAPRRQYMPSTRSQASQNYSASYAPSDMASQASRDTFDANIGEDIKGVVMAKLRDWATNGDLYRIREELRVLQANRKSLKVARYIPYTMNVLGVLFGQG